MTPEHRRQINEHMARLARNGHPESWRELYVLLRPFALAYARKRISPDNAEDLIQESFVRLREAAPRYREGADGYSFFSAVLRRVLWKHLSRQRGPGTIGSPLSLEAGEMKPASGTAFRDRLSAPERDAHVAHLRWELDAAIGRLSPALRAAAKARVLEGMKNLEAAQQAECSILAHKKRLARVIALLRSKLAKHHPLLLVSL